MLTALLLLGACESNWLGFGGLFEEAPPPAEAAADDSVAAEATVTPAEAPVPRLPPADAADLALRIAFEDGRSDLSSGAQSNLSALARSYGASSAPVIEIHAYWSSDTENLSGAKMFSLKRGMVVRSYLKARGLNLPRITLKQVQDDSAHFVDIVRLGS